MAPNAEPLLFSTASFAKSPLSDLSALVARLFAPDYETALKTGHVYDFFPLQRTDRPIRSCHREFPGEMR